MQVYFNIEEFEPTKNIVLTVGTFDGVHLGHSYIINRMNEIAESTGMESALLTFYPHPRMVLFPDDNDLRLLNTQEEKADLLDARNLNHLIVHPFTREFSRLNSVEFVRDILVNRLGVKKLVIGYDHHFGRNREGSFSDLEELAHLYGFEVEQINAQEFQDTKVSSTKIRNALVKGDIETVNHYLGYSYLLSGTVVKGKQIGRQIGFPTANIKVDKHKAIPNDGVYAVEVVIRGNVQKGMVNIGTRPSITDDGIKTIEVHIFDFNEDIYGDQVTLKMVGRIRDEKKFESLDALKEQLEIDQNKSIHMFRG